MKEIEKLVPDTSIIIEGLLSKKIENNEFKIGEVIIHEAVLSELEHQANQGRSIGLIGLDELKKIRELRENVFPYAKKGFPGNWKFTVLSQELLKQEEIQEIAKEIVEEAKIRTDGFIETERE